MNFTCWYAGCAQNQINEESIKTLAQMNVKHLVLVVNWYVKNLSDSHIYTQIGQHKSFGRQDVEKILRLADKYHLQVALKPHIEIVGQDPTYRGFYHPRNKDLFFRQYSDLFMQLLSWARPFRHLISDVIVGTELAFLSRYRKPWVNLIRVIRAEVSKEVKLSYAAFWSDFYLAAFWDQLDWIGIDAYFPLSFGHKPSPALLRKRWERWMQILYQWRDFNFPNKPLGFTEVGYLDRIGTIRMPWEWRIRGDYDPYEQYFAYQALIEAVKKRGSHFYALYLWVWDQHRFPVSKENSSFQPQGVVYDYLRSEFEGMH